MTVGAVVGDKRDDFFLKRFFCVYLRFFEFRIIRRSGSLGLAASKNQSYPGGDKSDATPSPHPCR